MRRSRRVRYRVDHPIRRDALLRSRTALSTLPFRRHSAAFRVRASAFASRWMDLFRSEDALFIARSIYWGGGGKVKVEPSSPFGDGEGLGFPKEGGGRSPHLPEAEVVEVYGVGNRLAVAGKAVATVGYNNPISHFILTDDFQHRFEHCNDFVIGVAFLHLTDSDLDDGVGHSGKGEGMSPIVNIKCTRIGGDLFGTHPQKGNQ